MSNALPGIQEREIDAPHQSHERAFLDEAFNSTPADLEKNEYFDFKILHHPQYLQQLLDEALFSLIEADDPDEMSVRSLRNEVAYLRGLLAQQDFYLRHFLKLRNGE